MGLKSLSYRVRQLRFCDLGPGNLGIGAERLIAYPGAQPKIAI